MLDHMSSTGVMRRDGRRRGEEMVKHERKRENISAVHAWYRNITAQTTEIEENASVSANTVAETPDRKAILKGILGMSAEERTQLLDELILNDQLSSSF